MAGKANDAVKFKVHAAALDAASPYFSAILRNPNHGLINPQTRELQLKRIDAHTMYTVLQYIYSGKAEISDRIIARVLDAAEFLSIPSLLTYTLNKINADNSVSVFVKLMELERFKFAEVCTRFLPGIPV